MRDKTEPHTVYVDHKVVDENQHEIGTVTDVIYGTSADHPEEDRVARTPTWMVVNPGLLRASHYLPVDGSYRSESGDIVVPWTDDWIKKSPKAGGHHVVTDELLADLTRHYDTPRDDSSGARDRVR